jgi:UDP-glucose 4-epimerase
MGLRSRLNNFLPRGLFVGGFKKVAVTGASGMTGRHLMEVLRQRNISCIASSRSKPLALPAQSAWVAWDLAEVKNPEELDDLFPQVEVIIHLGAYVPHKTEDSRDFQGIFDINVRACISLARWALVRRLPLLYLSGATVYRDVEKRNIKENDPKTTGGFGGFYGYSKLLAERTLQYFVSEGLKLCILRPSSIYGHGLAQGKMINNFLELAALDKCIQLTPPVDDKINLIHALDVAKAMVQAIEYGAWGVFNIGGEEDYSILEIVEACIKIVGRGKIEIMKSLKEDKAIYRFDLNSDLAKRTFGFNPSLNLYSGLKKMWDDKVTSEIIN